MKMKGKYKSSLFALVLMFALTFVTTGQAFALDNVADTWYNSFTQSVKDGFFSTYPSTQYNYYAVDIQGGSNALKQVYAIPKGVQFTEITQQSVDNSTLGTYRWRLNFTGAITTMGYMYFNGSSSGSWANSSNDYPSLLQGYWEFGNAKPAPIVYTATSNEVYSAYGLTQVDAKQDSTDKVYSCTIGYKLPYIEGVTDFNKINFSAVGEEGITIIESIKNTLSSFYLSPIWGTSDWLSSWSKGQAKFVDGGYTINQDTKQVEGKLIVSFTLKDGQHSYTIKCKDNNTGQDKEYSLVLDVNRYTDFIDTNADGKDDRTGSAYQDPTKAEDGNTYENRGWASTFSDMVKSVPAMLNGLGDMTDGIGGIMKDFFGFLPPPFTAILILGAIGMIFLKFVGR